MKKIILFSGAALLLFPSCERILIGEEVANTPVNNFNKLWADFDQYYGLFDVKQIDWDSMYNVYRPQVSDDMGDAGLYDAVTEMLAPLNDKHVTLYPTDPFLPRWSVDLDENGVFVTDFFNLDVVKDNYLADWHELNYSFRYGKTAPNIGYIYLKDFPGSMGDAKKKMDQILDALKDSKGIIIDIRENEGGFDPVAQYVAGRFADSRHHYMTTKKRNGPARTDFTEPVEWYVEPTGDFQYTGPIVLLTSRATISAGETFSLAMRELGHVTHIGEITAGAFSDNITKELYNGWMFTLSVGDYRASDGNSYEGVGLLPSVLIYNEKEDVKSGKDFALEKAVEALQ